MCVARGETLVSLADFLIESERAQRPWHEIRDVLVERFALSYPYARLAWDRAAGGAVRAETKIPENEPDRVTDPVAWIAYQRALDRPVEVPAPGDQRETSERAMKHIAESFAAREMRGTDDVDVALMIASIAVARAPEAPTEAAAANLLVLGATALSTAIEAQIDARGVQRCAPEGSQAWVDANALAAASKQVAQAFAARGWIDLEQRALELRGRAVTGLLGQCRARVGAAMLEGLRGARAAGDDAAAEGLGEAVIGDFAVVVDEWEATTDIPFDEHRIALEHLLATLDELAAIRGGRLAPNAASLRARCAALLERAAGSPAADRC